MYLPYVTILFLVPKCSQINLKSRRYRWFLRIEGTTRQSVDFTITCCSVEWNKSTGIECQLNICIIEPCRFVAYLLSIQVRWVQWQVTSLMQSQCTTSVWRDFFNKYTVLKYASHVHWKLWQQRYDVYPVMMIQTQIWGRFSGYYFKAKCKQLCTQVVEFYGKFRTHIHTDHEFLDF